MKKIKFLIASMLGAIALVFACILGTKVNAASTSYTVKGSDFDSTATAGTFGSSTQITKSSALTFHDGKISTNLKKFYYETIYTNDALVTGVSAATNASTYDFASNPNVARVSGTSFTMTFDVAEGETAYAEFYFLATTTGKKFKGSSNNNLFVTDTVANANEDTFIKDITAAATSKKIGVNTVYYVKITNITSSAKTLSFENMGFSLLEMTLTVQAAKTFSELKSVNVNKTDYQVGETVTASDLTVVASYVNEPDEETDKFTFKVYNSNDVEVTGTFTTSGEGYYVVVTSTEGESSVTSDTFSVAAQTKFTYIMDTLANATSSTKTDYSFADGVISVQQAILANGGSFTFADGYSVSGVKYAQASTIILDLDEAAKVTIYATQSGSTANKHGIRYMYFEDENGNSIVSNMNFSMTNVPSNTKVFTLNLAKGTYTSYSTDGVFNFYTIVIDYTNTSTIDTTQQTMIMTHETGTAINGTGTAARFVGALKNVEYTEIDSITIEFTLSLNDTDKTVKNASATIQKVYTALPEHSADDTIYFYFIIKGLEAEKYANCTIKATTTIVLSNGNKCLNTTTWSA